MIRRTLRPGSTARQLRLAVARGFHRQYASAPDRSAEPVAADVGISDRPARSLAIAFGWAAIAFFVLAVLRRGWISDDAFITMRAVDHLIEGRGFVYNADERVLGFTNPLWALFLALPYLFVRDPYLAPVVGSVVVSTAMAAYLVFRGAKDCRVGALVLFALSFSRSFVDFSTSGLENPLSHLLLVLLYVEFLRDDRFSIGRLSFYCALVLINRFDLALLVLPVMVYAYRYRTTKADRRSVLLGWAPVVAWIVFAVAYYGFPLPNTAYAKLNAEIPKREMIRQGLSYLADALVNDSQTVILIVAACLVLFASRKRDPKVGAIALAITLGVAYVVLIGGDFMSGRFLTPLLAVSAVVLVDRAGAWLDRAERLRVAALAVVGVAFCLGFSPFRDDPLREKREFPSTRIVNERAWFQEHLLLHLNLRPVQWKTYGLYVEGRNARNQNRRVVLYNNVGMFAWGTGPDIHVVDDMALTDPLLARIPFEYREDWRTGHLPRPIPEGYLDSLETGKNVIRDPCIADYFNHLDRVVRGPLFSAERWASIVTLNLPGGMTVRACPDRIPAAAAVPSVPNPDVPAMNVAPEGPAPEPTPP